MGPGPSLGETRLPVFPRGPSPPVGDLPQPPPCSPSAPAPGLLQALLASSAARVSPWSQPGLPFVVANAIFAASVPLSCQPSFQGSDTRGLQRHLPGTCSVFPVTGLGPAR